MFTYFKQRRLRSEKARSLYQAAEAQARLPAFYSEYGVPDTVDGRFELISLHCFILMRRLKASGEEKLSQALFDAFFKTMDKSLREMGVGDLGVPKHMKRMMQGFNGRANHYEQALRSHNNQLLYEAVTRNVYGTIENPDKNNIEFLTHYIKDSAEIKSADPVFADLEARKKKVA